jgi:hypothetical protein
MTENTPDKIYGLADAQKRTRDGPIYKIGRALGELLASVGSLAVIVLAGWKALELVGVL